MRQAPQPPPGRETLFRDNPLKKNVFSRGLIGIVVVFVSGAAWGQTGAREDYADRQLSLSTRINPEYDPEPVRIGDFLLSPSLTNALSFDDNVYRRDDGPMDDMIYTVTPSIGLRSDFARHALSAGAFLERGLYQDLTSENYTDYGANVGGTIDVTGQTSVPLRLSYTRDHVRRGLPDEFFAQEPTFFDLWDGTMSVVHDGGRLAMKLIANMQRIVFDNVTGTSGDVIDNGDRDRNIYSLYGSIGMPSAAVFAPFVYSNVLKLDYDRPVDDNGLNRDAMQYEAGVGTIINLSDVTAASFTLGGLDRQIEDASLDDIRDFTYGVNVKWEPSTLASFLLTGDRTVQETTRNDASAAVKSSLRLIMDYELFPNLILRPSASISEAEYEGDAGGRVVTSGGGMQLTYKMNQNLWLSTSYQYTNQVEKEPVEDLDEFDSNIVSISLRMQF